MRSAFALLAVGYLAVTTHTQSSPQPSGAAVAWERLQKLRTPVSVLHITAHPDDEHGGVLAKLSRGDGARVAMLTLTRGEAGDNAIGPQLFDALGLIRTEELLAANRAYGVDQQYFTTAVDYGYSKLLEEAFDKWGREAVLRDVVRVIRMERPTIILSRFQGSARDGHGNHMAAGIMAQEAFSAAADPKRYPEQMRDGLQPWAASKIYIGGMRAEEDWNVRVNTGEYSATLGDTFENVARHGLGFQRSQNGGRVTPAPSPNFVHFKLAAWSGTVVKSTPGAKEESMLDLLPRSLEDAIGTVARPIDAAVARAVADFRINDPAASASALAEGLKLTRDAIARAVEPQARHLLRVKEQQFQDAINAAVGAQLTAITTPPAMGAPVPGQTFIVDARLDVRGRSDVKADAPSLTGAAGWRVERASSGSFRVTVAADAHISTKPYFHRNGLQDNRYTLSDPAQFGRPVAAPPLVATAQYSVDGVPISIREIVKRRESRAPYGDAVVDVRSVPRIAITMTPANAIVPIGQKGRAIDVEVSLLHNADTPSNGQLVLRLPDGWRAKPASQAFTFTRAGERFSLRFVVTPSVVSAQNYEIEAAAIDALAEYREGYDLIDHRDLELRYLYRDATTTVRGVDVATVPGLKVGYVMGVGDQVPQGLQQLGAQVTLLGERELAGSSLSAYDAIITGTRAYAVREDLKTHNARLLDYARNGGNVIVLYNTPEFVPNTFAPFPADLPRTAEEVSEEDSPVSFLAPAHQVFNWPNRITNADFDGWVEQRGSKFFATWDAAYTPMIAMHDKGQSPQAGGWLTARVGKGHWTYFAYALHRQLPYGVPGAYRITANLLALNKQQR